MADGPQDPTKPGQPKPDPMLRLQYYMETNQWDLADQYRQYLKETNQYHPTPETNPLHHEFQTGMLDQRLQRETQAMQDELAADRAKAIENASPAQRVLGTLASVAGGVGDPTENIAALGRQGLSHIPFLNRITGGTQTFNEALADIQAGKLAARNEKMRIPGLYQASQLPVVGPFVPGTTGDLMTTAGNIAKFGALSELGLSGAGAGTILGGIQGVGQANPDATWKERLGSGAWNAALLGTIGRAGDIAAGEATALRPGIASSEQVAAGIRNKIKALKAGMYKDADVEAATRVTSPGLQRVMQDPTIQGYVDLARSDPKNAGLNDAQLAMKAHNLMSDNTVDLQTKINSRGLQEKPTAQAITELNILNHAKQQLRTALGEPSQAAPTVIPGRPAQQVGEREPVTGPIPEGTAGITRGSALVAQDPSGRTTMVPAKDVQGPAAPSFMLRGNPGQTIPEVPERVIPSPIVPGAAPSFDPATRAAGELYGKLNRASEAAQQTSDIINRRPFPLAQYFNKGRLAFLDQLREMSPEEAADALLGIQGQIRQEAGGLRGAGRAARGAELVSAAQRQISGQPTTMLDFLRALGVSPFTQLGISQPDQTQP